MPPQEARSFATSISSGNVQNMWDALKNIKIENADASVEEDKVNIFRAVEDGPGYFRLNEAVRSRLQKWVIESGEIIVRGVLISCHGNIEELAMACGHVAQLSIFTGQ